MRSARNILLLLIAPLLVGGYAWYRYTYPYGASHCCDKQLYFALHEYAHRNGGDFPAGEATPEASLSSVHRALSSSYAYLLCGKSGSESLSQEILDRGELLGPETCGWNYVEGLRTDDNPRLALFWDKEGLGHNGERLTGGGHIVTFVGGMSEHIVKQEWSTFLAEQQALYEERKNKSRKGAIPQSRPAPPDNIPIQRR